MVRKKEEEKERKISAIPFSLLGAEVHGPTDFTAYLPSNPAPPEIFKLRAS
jgi:hypothetical protein